MDIAAIPSSSTDSEVHHFDALAADTGESWWGHRTAAGRFRLARRAGLVLQSLVNPSEDKVLEVGAGCGALSEAILHACPNLRLTCTDVSRRSVQQLLSRLASYPHVIAAVEDATRLSYPECAFNAVIGNSIWHHLGQGQAAREWYRVLRPGGRLILFEPNLMNPQVWLEMTLARHVTSLNLQYSPTERTHTRWTYRRRLREAGFEEASVLPFDFMHPIMRGPLMKIVELLGPWMECVPILREASGSLLITAQRPC